MPMDTLRVLAGFAATPGTYFLPRQKIIPCPELQKQVFPQLESSYETVQSNEKDISAEHFFRAFKAFRIILLQDAAVLLSMVN